MSDFVTININGLDVAIKCAICTNPIRTYAGCDGLCRYDKSTFEKVKEAVNGCIVERPHGEWISTLYRTGDRHNYNCSICDEESEYSTPFCPNCGADMREGG